jgi:hypothetical protein
MNWQWVAGTGTDSLFSRSAQSKPLRRLSLHRLLAPASPSLRPVVAPASLSLHRVLALRRFPSIEW